MTLVIDLSHHNVVPESLIPAREFGVVGVIHKATEGVSFVDSKLTSRYHLAVDAGLLWGVYHFIRPGDMQAQVDHFVKTSMSVSDYATLFALDYEDVDVSLEDVAFFMKELQAQVNVSPILYSGHVLKEKMAENPVNELTQYRLWLAQYSASPVLPIGWKELFLWQYTDKGEVPGITPPTDMNEYQYSPRDLEAEWIGDENYDFDDLPGDKIVRVIAPPGVEIVVEYPKESK